MLRSFGKSKIHRATITEARLDYEGSIGIDPDLLDAADILPGEQVHVFNLHTGDRFHTYTIVGKRGSGEISLNGAAARCGSPGDKVIILTYGLMDAKEAAGHKLRVVHVDERNRITDAK